MAKSSRGMYFNTLGGFDTQGIDMYRSMNNYEEGLNVQVDLDAEQGRPVGKALNQFRLFVRPTKKVNLAVLKAWLEGRISMGEGVLEALSELSRP